MKLFLEILGRYLQVETGQVEYVDREAEEGGDEPPTQLGYPMTEDPPPLGFRVLGEYGEINPEINRGER